MEASNHGLLATAGQHPLITAAFAVAAIAALYLWLLPRPIPGIPYDKRATRTPLGDLPDLLSYTKRTGYLLPYFPALIEKHKSPIVQVFLPPTFQADIIVADPATVEDVLIRRTKEFDRSQVMVDVFKGGAPNHHIAMKTADPRFKGNKELVRDLMSPAFLHGTSAAEIYLKTTHLIELWHFKAKHAKGRPVDAGQDVKDAALDMIFAAAFAFNDGLSSNRHQLSYLTSLTSFQPQTAPNGMARFPLADPIPEAKLFYDVIRHAGAPAASPFPTLTYNWQWYTSARVRRDTAAKDIVIQREVRKSLERLGARDDDGVSHSAVDNILRREKLVAAKEGREPDYFSHRVQDELFGYIVAGFETTATSLRWNLKLMTDHQEVQEKTRAALREGFPAAVAEGRAPTAKEILDSDIPYLDAVIEECLRIGNPIRILHRDALVDTELLGHHIPKGTTVFFLSEGPGYKRPTLHVDDRLRTESAREKHRTGAWDNDDIHLLKPERWLVEEDGKTRFDPHAGPFLSFSLGPRGCFGKKLAYMEIRMIMVLCLWNFRFKELAEDMQSYAITEGITNSPKDCRVILEEVHW